MDSRHRGAIWAATIAPSVSGAAAHGYTVIDAAGDATIGNPANLTNTSPTDGCDRSSTGST